MTLAAALAAIAAFVPVPGGITYHLAPCPERPDAEACATPYQAQVWIRPRALRQRSLYAREVVAHELGHVWDVRHLSERDRGQWSRLVGAEGASWYGLPQFGDPAPPAEQFADAFALCAVGPAGRARERYTVRPHHPLYVGGYGEALTSTQVGVACWLTQHR